MLGNTAVPDKFPGASFDTTTAVSKLTTTWGQSFSCLAIEHCTSYSSPTPNARQTCKSLYLQRLFSSIRLIYTISMLSYLSQILFSRWSLFLTSAVPCCPSSSSIFTGILLTFFSSISLDLDDPLSSGPSTDWVFCFFCGLSSAFLRASRANASFSLCRTSSFEYLIVASLRRVTTTSSWVRHQQ